MNDVNKTSCTRGIMMSKLSILTKTIVAASIAFTSMSVDAGTRAERLAAKDAKHSNKLMADNGLDGSVIFTSVGDTIITVTRHDYSKSISTAVSMYYKMIDSEKNEEKKTVLKWELRKMLSSAITGTICSNNYHKDLLKSGVKIKLVHVYTDAIDVYDINKCPKETK